MFEYIELFEESEFVPLVPAAVYQPVIDGGVDHLGDFDCPTGWFSTLKLTLVGAL